MASSPASLRSRRTVVAIAILDQALSATLRASLAAESDVLVIVCSSPGAAGFVSWLDENRAEVLLLDERCLNQVGAGSAPSLHEGWSGRRVLLVGDRASTALVEQVVRRRFHGFLLARGAAAACVKAVRAVRRGEMWVPRALLVQSLLERVQGAAHDRPDTGVDSKLTRREIEVVGYVRRGFANKQIADALALREDTIKKHLRNAYAKLGVHRRAEIIVASAQPTS